MLASGLAAKSLAGVANSGARAFQWLTNLRSVVPDQIWVNADVNATTAYPGANVSGTSGIELRDTLESLVRAAAASTEQMYVFVHGHGMTVYDKSQPSAVIRETFVGGDFRTPNASGGKCLDIDEVANLLMTSLGPGEHYWFVDMCRNECSADDIDVSSVGKRFTRVLGNPSRYFLFSTKRGQPAVVNSGFAESLIHGLEGDGRAKAWMDGQLGVYFDPLAKFIQSRMQTQQIEAKSEPRRTPPAPLLAIRPAPRHRCDVLVSGASAADSFTLTRSPARDVSLTTDDTFTGPNFTFNDESDEYVIFAFHNGRPLRPQSKTVDLFEADITIVFDMPTKPAVIEPTEIHKGIEEEVDAPGEELPGYAHVQPLDLPRIVVRGAHDQETERENPNDSDVEDRPTARVIANAPGRHLELVRVGEQRPIRVDESKDVEPGSYVARWIDDTTHSVVDERTISLSAGEQDLGSTGRLADEWAVTPLHRAIIDTLPQWARAVGSVQFSESMGSLADDDLAVWLAIIGASDIVAPPSEFSKLSAISMFDMTLATPYLSQLCVVSGPARSLSVSVEGAQPQTGRLVVNVDGLCCLQTEASPGPKIATVMVDGGPPYTVVTHCLPNRATLLVLVPTERGLELRQSSLPIHSLLDRGGGDAELLHTVKSRHGALDWVRLGAQVQRRFGRNEPIVVSDRDQLNWREPIHGKFFDPFMGIVSAYEGVRAGDDPPLIERAIINLRDAYPGIPDVAYLLQVMGTDVPDPLTPPLVLEGAVAVDATAYAGLDPNRIDHRSIWTMWIAAPNSGT